MYCLQRNALLYENRQGLASLLYNQCERCGNLNKIATLPVSILYNSYYCCYLSLTTFSLKQPAGGASYYARRLSKSRPS